MKKNIAVIFGGKSAEHDVSIITAHNPIIESLLTMKDQYNVTPVYISKKGIWYSTPEMNDMKYFKNPNYESTLTNLKPLNISTDNGLTLFTSGLLGKKMKIDLVFPAMHGTFGEDGSLMGLLRMANVPFVGCDLFASAVAMDKVLTKDLIRANGVPVVKDVWFVKSEWENKDKRNEIKNRLAELKLPLFVKPVHLGSSIGITKVTKSIELDNAIEVALHYDNKVLVEEGVENLIEVTLPMIGNDMVEFAAVERPMNKTEFFDFNDKYLAGGKKTGGVNSQYSEIPANIGAELTDRVKTLGERTYKILGCSGIARVDFLIDSSTNTVYVNEVNTLPGSLYSHNWRKTGVSNVDLINKLISFAEQRFAENQKTTLTFNSTILQQSGGGKKVS